MEGEWGRRKHVDKETGAQNVIIAVNLSALRVKFSHQTVSNIVIPDEDWYIIEKIANTCTF